MALSAPTTEKHWNHHWASPGSPFSHLHILCTHTCPSSLLQPWQKRCPPPHLSNPSPCALGHPHPHPLTQHVFSHCSFPLNMGLQWLLLPFPGGGVLTPKFPSSFWIIIMIPLGESSPASPCCISRDSGATFSHGVPQPPLN